jgi:molybdate transport system substrate-binding protein
MKTISLALGGLVLGLALDMTMMADGHAAELQVLAGGGIAEPMKELGPKFEALSGHRLTIRFGTTPQLIKMSGEAPFDVGVVPADMMKDDDARARFAPGPVTVARVGFGIAVRAGAARPDIGTPDKLKQALLNATSVATVPASAAGGQVLRVFDALGIGEAMKAKIKAQPGPAQMVKAVADGEAELGVFLTNVLHAPGLDVVGPLPAAVQHEFIYSAGVAADSKQPEAAKTFIEFLCSPDAAAVLKAKGMTPG